MKKCTALFMAFFMIVIIVGGGVVFFSVPVRAVEYTADLERDDLPIVSAADVATNGTILCSNGTNIVRAGSNENGLYPFVSDNGQVRVASLNPGKLFIYDNSGSVSSVNADSKTYQYNQNTNTLIYQNNIQFTGYSFTIPSSGVGAFNLMYDAAVVLCFQGSYKAASTLTYQSYSANSIIYINNDDSIDITNAVGSNAAYGYVVRVGSRIYVISNSGSVRATRFKLNISDYIEINQSYIIDNNTFLYGYYDYNSPNIAVLGFNTLKDAMDQVYYWETGLYPEPEPEPEPDPDPEPNPGPSPIVGGTTFVLKPGYACDIFYSGESYEITARRIGQNRSSLFQINGYWWPYDNVLIANGVSTPITQNMDIFSSSEFSKIPWQKEPPYNLFGITYNSYYHVSGYDGHTVIANPVHYYGAGDGYNVPIQEQQSPIKITVSDEVSQLTIYCWSLADSIDNNVITSTTVTRYTLGNDGMWYTENDEMVVLEIGGETEVVNNQQATLDDLVSNIKTFFEGTWRHIRQLVTSAGKLPSVVVEMYSWLPEEYKAVLFSAFGIVVVVGILKVML